jgi:hypothetical protein
MIAGLGLSFVLGIVVIVSYLVLSGLEELEEHNAKMREAIKMLTQNRDALMTQSARQRAFELRIANPLELNRFVETAASAAGVSIAESGEITPVSGDRYIQRGVEIKLRKVNLEQLAKMMKELEGSKNVVQITRLSVNTRWNQHQDLEVEMVVSTWEKKKKIDTRPTGKDKAKRERDRI